MSLNRSIERDYDINFYCRLAHKAMDEVEEAVAMLLAVDHNTQPLIRSLNEQWTSLREKLELISY